MSAGAPGCRPQWSLRAGWVSRPSACRATPSTWLQTLDKAQVGIEFFCDPGQCRDRRADDSAFDQPTGAYSAIRAQSEVGLAVVLGAYVGPSLIVRNGRFDPISQYAGP
jgi:hypothetical protein